MKFIKDHSYDIIRLYIIQIGISIFSLLLYTSVSGLDDKDLANKLKIAISIFAILFFFALIYTLSWEWGANDIIRIDAGRQKKNVFKGTILAACANILNVILAGACIISMVAYMNGSGGALSVLQVFNLILRMTDAMYIGVLMSIFSFAEGTDLYNLYQSIGYMLTPLLSMAVTHVGYVFGLKNIKIFGSKAKKS